MAARPIPRRADRPFQTTPRAEPASPDAGFASEASCDLADECLPEGARHECADALLLETGPLGSLEPALQLVSQPCVVLDRRSRERARDERPAALARGH